MSQLGVPKPLQSVPPPSKPEEKIIVEKKEEKIEETTPKNQNEQKQSSSSISKKKKKKNKNKNKKEELVFEPTFEEQLDWCCWQLQLGIKRPGATKDQIKEAMSVLSTLSSDKATKVKKQHTMHVVFGDVKKYMKQMPKTAPIKKTNKKKAIKSGEVNSQENKEENENIEENGVIEYKEETEEKKEESDVKEQTNNETKDKEANE